MWFIMILILPIYSIFLLILLLVVFTVKDRFKSYETNIYFMLLIISFLNVLFNIIGIYMGYNGGSIRFLYFLDFLYISYTYYKKSSLFFEKVLLFLLFWRLLLLHRPLFKWPLKIQCFQWKMKCFSFYIVVHKISI